MASDPDLSPLLKRLVRVKKGQQLDDAITSDLLNAIMELLERLARGDNIRTGDAFRKKQGPSWVMISGEKQWQFDRVTKHAPFEVMPGVQDGPGPALIGVNPDSHLINASNKDAYEEDNTAWGLLSEDLTTGGFSVEDLNLGDKIYLKFTLDQSRNVTGIELVHGAVGDSDWSLYPDPIEINTDDTPYQEYFYQLIAEVTDPEQDPRPGLIYTKADTSGIQITQLLRSNLVLTNGHTTQDADEPNVPLMVCVGECAPGTSADGNADPIDDQTDVKTPWSFGDIALRPAFSVYDAGPDGEGNPQIGIEDGILQFADGVLEDDSGQGGSPTGMGTGVPFVMQVESSHVYVWIEINFEPPDDDTIPVSVLSYSLSSGSSADFYDTAQDKTLLRIIIANIVVTGTSVRVGYGKWGIGSQFIDACRNYFVDASDNHAWGYKPNAL